MTLGKGGGRARFADSAEVGRKSAGQPYSTGMGFETRGKIHFINDTQQVTERFRKREFVLELADNPKYPQFVQFQLTGDRCENLDGFSVGDEIQVEFSLRGREWKSPKGDVKFFNSLDVWTIQRDAEAGAGFDEPPFPSDPPPEADEEIPF
jgi:hypothetical protein